MTPQDIAVNVSSIHVPGQGTINTSTNFTQSSRIGGYIVDDANTWD